MQRKWDNALVILTCLLLALGIGTAQADDNEAGLLWNRTGLPAVFPLQVKTPAGANYVVTLLQRESGVPALAARIVGGRFFKVLVPPGSFVVQFAPDGGAPPFQLADPLVFEILDAGTKGGHLIDLSDLSSGVVVRAQFICQRVAVDSFSRPQEPFDAVEGYATRLTEEGEIVRFPSQFTEERLSAGRDQPILPTDFAPYFSDPILGVKTVPCP